MLCRQQGMSPAAANLVATKAESVLAAATVVVAQAVNLPTVVLQLPLHRHVCWPGRQLRRPAAIAPQQQRTAAGQRQLPNKVPAHQGSSFQAQQALHELLLAVLVVVAEALQPLPRK